MVDLLPIIEHLTPYSLVLTRLLGLVMFAPVISSGALPVQARVALVAMTAAAVYGLLPPVWHEPPDVDLPGLVWLLFGELLLGISIGFIAALPLIAVEIAGHIMGYQMGLGIAQVYDPEAETNLNSIGSLLHFMALAILIGTGGLEALLAHTIETYHAIGPGGFANQQPALELAVAVLSSGTSLAISVAMPVLGSVFVMLLVIGFIMKTMPQINVMTIGFALKIVTGLIMLALSIFVIDGVLAQFIVDAIEEIGVWTSSLNQGA